ncbi:MAG TPA: hypothetical protein VGQ69_05330 [Gemmatimonadales bacterium]|nr:hypothetical protein [Gemmatimonadales bacterium]
MSRLTSALALSATVAFASVAHAQQQVADSLLSQLKYRYIGPEGNRVSAVAGVSGDPRTYYAGAASGGLWKSSDAGSHWKPVFDEQPVASIGAIGVAPSDPNVVWAGTGEPFIRSHISLGWGVYKSTDAGTSWKKMGLDNTGRIARIVIDPRNPDVVFVAALGHAYGPQPERGVYRTSDGGKSWERVLFVNDSTGAVDLVMDPSNPRILLAAMWQIEIHTWGRESGGAGSGLWKSTDGGTTWKRLTGHGLPETPVGRIGLGFARSNPGRVYALIETGDGVLIHGKDAGKGELWRSDDRGESWQMISTDRQLAGRTQYYTRLAVAPDNENEVYFAAAHWSKTLDGGKTTIDPPNAEIPGGDHHDIWIDPLDASRLAVGHDGGISISINRGKSWQQIQLPIAQMYHVTVDNRVPYFVYGNRQDGPSTMGPSNSRLGTGEGTIPRGLFHSVSGGESGWATPDPEDPNIVWSSASGWGAAGGVVTRYDLRTGMARNVEVWPDAPMGSPAADLKYRFVWNFPLTISPHDHNKVYVGSQHIHMTTDGGNTWKLISPDLTRNDKSRQGISGGLTPDNIGVEYAGVVFAIAESRLKPGLIWAGSNDGLVQLSKDGGAAWTNVSPNLPGMPAWGTISSIAPSRYDTASAYLTVDAHQVNNRDPWVYKTTDYGKTWRLIVNGLAKTPLSYAHIIIEDPVRRGLLYLGTEGGLFVSFDDGGTWQPLQNNLPHAPVYGLVVQEHFSDLVVATYGRGFWILDDLTPLRELGPSVVAKPTHLFAPRAAYRFRGVEGPFAPWYDASAGQNPTYGATIHYWLKAGSKDSVAFSVLDAGGKPVRSFKGPADTGLNRVYWDLRFDLSKEAKLRTPPRAAPELTVPAEGRKAPDGARLALLAPPGAYTVKLAVQGQEATQRLEVRKDPGSGGSEEDIRVQTALLQEIRGDLESVVGMLNSIEGTRSQLVALRNTLAADTGMAELRNDADSLEQKLIGVEEALTQLNLTGRGQDDVRYPMKLMARLSWLADGIGSSDFAPTLQQREVQQLLHTEVRAARARLDALQQKDVAGFNEKLRKRNVANIVVVQP